MNIQKLRSMLDKHEISVTELTKEYLDKISVVDKKINAFLLVNYDNAMKAAENAQKRIDEARAMPLTGIPIALNDNLCTYDMLTTCASKMLDGYMPPYDATAVERLRAQDAIFLGKLNIDEFGMGATTETSYYNQTHNPYNLRCTPGGASGGSAAAISAGLCAAALATDTGGSIRQPAAFCGVTGFRPTYGTVSRYGCVAFASSLDQVGPIAKSARDCGLVLEAISGADNRDQTSISGKAFIPCFGESIKGKKLGLITEFPGAAIDDEIIANIEKAADWYRAAGAIVEKVNLPMLEYAVPAFLLISSAEASANLSKFDGVRFGLNTGGAADFYGLISRNRAEGFGREVKRRILLGSFALCSDNYEAYYKKAVRLSNAIRTQYNELFNRYDALISPVNPTVAYEFDKTPKNPVQMYLGDICTAGVSLAGLPSLSTPCGYTKTGLPIGMMLTGKSRDDAFILSLADAFEREFERLEPDTEGSV